jgi:hypothetical protein
LTVLRRWLMGSSGFLMPIKNRHPLLPISQHLLVVVRLSLALSLLRLRISDTPVGLLANCLS